MLYLDLDPCSGNARTLSGPEGSSNKGCLRQARTPGLFFWEFFGKVAGKVFLAKHQDYPKKFKSFARQILRFVKPLNVPGVSLYTEREWLGIALQSWAAGSINGPNPLKPLC